MSSAYRRIILSLTALTALLLPVWIIYHFSWQNGIDQLRQSNQQQLDQFIEHLDNKLARFQFLPHLIAKNRILVELLEDAKNTSRVDVVNHFLEEINSITGAADTYLMDAEGLTLAASNWQSELPFIGRNFSFRPYFIEASKGRPGRYFALGTTSGKRGYYFAYPIIYAANVIGVIVIKMDLSNIELRWSNRGSQFVVSDRDGVIFITTRKDWLFQSLGPIDAETRKKITDSRRYQNIDIEPLSIIKKEVFSDHSSMLKIIEDKHSEDHQYLTLNRYMPGAGWNVMIMTPVENIQQDSLVTVIVLLLVISLLLLMVLLAWQRHKRRQERERFQLQSRKQLESEVDLRTRDLTAEIEQHRETEKRLVETQGELIQTAKLAVLGELSASISHELNNPLAAIRSYADNARQFIALNKTIEADENLNRIAGLTERMAKISSQLKFFARKSTGKLKTVKVHSVIKNAIDIVQPQSRRNNIQLSMKAINKTLMAETDMIQLEQVLINLINNAMNAIGDEPQGLVEIKTEQQKEWVLIHVEDNGPGINENHLDKIFDPFFTTKKSGLGLGLSISARILDSMNGHLSASNLASGGARFTISLLAVEKQH